MTLPASPRDPYYSELIEEYNGLLEAAAQSQRLAPEKAAQLEAQAYSLLAAQAELDFWFYCRYVTTLRYYRIEDLDHPMVGDLWVNHPWIFDRCRWLQDGIETRSIDDCFINWPRFHLKTTLCTQHLSTWSISKDPQMTVALLTYKFDQVGDKMFNGYRTELRDNPLYVKCWPHIWPDAKGELLGTNKELTVHRKPGPREPTLSVHSLATMPTSWHVRRMVIDDAVVRETVQTQSSILTTESDLKNTVALGRDDTLSLYVGTIWDGNDPYVRALKDGFFSDRNHWTWRGQPGKLKSKPILLSESHCAKWRRKMGPYVWSCQMDGIPVAKHHRRLKDEWLTFYHNEPQEEAIGKNVYFIVDFAGKGKNFFALAVIGLGADGFMYVLDLYREPWGLNEGIDLVFSLHTKWRPLNVFVEEFGASGYTESVERVMEYKKYRFSCTPIPSVTNRSKEQRIEKYSNRQREGKYWWPVNGFGHGSDGDERDTWDQFKSDEYAVWSEQEGSSLTDDMLDVIAWPCNTALEQLMDYPVETSFANPFNKSGPTSEFGLPAGVSGWAL